MAIRASLTRIPPEVYESVRASGGFAPNAEFLGQNYNWQEFGRTGIDTSWSTLHKAFGKAGYPLEHTLEGDYHPAGGLGLFSNTGERDSYLAYVSPELTKDVAVALAEFPIKQALLEFEKDAKYLAYCLAYFDDLVRFYQETASKGEAIFISVN